MEYNSFHEFEEVNLFIGVFVKTISLFNIRQLLLHFSILCNESSLYDLVFFLAYSDFSGSLSGHVSMFTKRKMEAVCTSVKPTLGAIVFSLGRDSAYH
jgi:hypothetical protein